MPMTLLRTALIYALLLLAMRLLGKRQLGELELSELVGADRFLHLRYDANDTLVPPVIVRGSVRDRFPVGTKLWIGADMNMFLFFDVNSSERIR